MHLSLLNVIHCELSFQQKHHRNALSRWTQIKFLHYGTNVKHFEVCLSVCIEAATTYRLHNQGKYKLSSSSEYYMTS